MPLSRAERGIVLKVLDRYPKGFGNNWGDHEWMAKGDPDESIQVAAEKEPDLALEHG